MKRLLRDAFKLGVMLLLMIPLVAVLTLVIKIWWEVIDYVWHLW
jgi:hypothetical protein